jgi:serine/threonine protein phosphatase PrpC
MAPTSGFEKKEHVTPMAMNGRRRKVSSAQGGPLADRLAILRRRWFTISAGELLAVPAGMSCTDGTYVHDGVFAVADGVDDVAGSGISALAEVVGWMHPLSDDRRLRAALHTASWSLRSGPARHGDRGAASVTVAFWTGLRFVVGHVGDSRAYLWRKNVIRQLTRDQHRPIPFPLPPLHLSDDGDDEWVARLGQAGPGPAPEVLSVPVEPADRVLLCTDGLWRETTEEELAVALSGSPEVACVELRRRLQHRLTENAAAVVIAVDPVISAPERR